MRNNKRGLSTIIATLVIILLTLVAVGIIWVVVDNLFVGGSFDNEILKNIAVNVCEENGLNFSSVGYTISAPKIVCLKDRREKIILEFLPEELKEAER